MKEKMTVWQKVGMFFYSKKRMTSLLFLVVSIFGLLSYTTLMRREGFPAVDVPIGFVQAISFGTDAKTNDTSIALPLVTAAEGREAVKSVSSSATDQGAAVTLLYKDGTDVQKELDELKSEVSAQLPADARVLYLKVNSGKLTTEGDDLLVSVHSPDLSLEKLDEQAGILAPLLKESSDLIADMHVFPSYETVTNPVTGETVRQQVRFDRFYDEKRDEIVPSVVIGVTGKQGVDQLKLYDEVVAFLASDIVSSKGIEAEVSANFAEGIREQVAGLQTNLLEGLAVVLVISFILISLRSSIATALSMTATVLITVGVLNLIDYSLNTITLFSLVLCLALIVDDTTIMVEAIDAGLKRGGKYKEVVSEAMRRVARASATGTLTTILAFAPMLFIGGILGKFVRAIPVTIIISLIVSLIVSFIFIPLIIRFTYGRKVKYGVRRFNLAEKLEDTIGHSLASTLVWSDKSKKRRIGMRTSAVLIGLAFLVGGGAIFGRVGFNIFPAPKDGIDLVVSGQVIDRENATIENTQNITDQAMVVVQEVLGEDLERLTLTAQNGSASRDGFTAGVLISPIGSRDKTSVELATELQIALDERVEGMRFVSESAGVGPPAGSFAVQVNSDDAAKAYALATDLKALLETTTLTRLDDTTAKLTDITVTPSTVVRREDGNRVIAVSGGFDAKDTSALVTLAQDAVEEEFTTEKLAGYGLSEDALSFNFGQEEENQDSFASMGQAAGPLFLAMFVVMALLFRSLLQPLLILTALPFAIFGVASGLYLTDNEISFFSMLGVFALIGISLNNTILLTDFANQSMKSKTKASDAMALAIKERLRPLLTTSVTSVLALLPLALNDPFWEGLAYTLIFGLISSTILVLLVFPYYYLINDSISRGFRKLYRLVVKTKRA